MSPHRLSLVFAALFSLTAQAGAPAASCPQGLEGDWKCKAQYMPGDGSETSFTLQIGATRVGDEIRSYVFSDAVYFLDGASHTVPPSPGSALTTVWARTSSCRDGKLVSDYTGHEEDGSPALPANQEVTQMLDSDTLTMTQPFASDTSICCRVGKTCAQWNATLWGGSSGS